MLAVPPAAAGQAAASAWVYPGPDGKLVYKTTPAGDRIMDFSHAGYKGGGVPLPTVPVKQTVQPTGGDDTAAIQSAVDAVSDMPLQDGFRGAVLLAPGTFTISRTIAITASGVVLRGSGEQGADRSTLRLTGRPFTAVAIRQAGRRQRGEQQPLGGVQTEIADAYVPSGAQSFTVADVNGLAAGDTILIRKPVTEAWIKFMQMDDLVRDSRPQTWLAVGSTVDAERQIAAIFGRTIVLDVPLSDSYDSKWLTPPGTKVVKISPPQRICNAGVEFLHIQSPPQPISHTQPHFSALRISGQDCWARNLIIDETMNSVGVTGCRITLERVAVNRKARHQGSSRPAEFAPNASQVLLNRCSVSADNVWFVGTGARVSGPIVILNADFRGDSRAEAHQRWSTGLLFDNVTAPAGGLELRNRGSMGSGHGWTMGWGVIWNCTAKDYIVQNPPGAVNWIIGSIGQIKTAARPFADRPDLPGAAVDAHGKPVMPQSLYLAQLAERLGPQALKNIGY